MMIFNWDIRRFHVVVKSCRCQTRIVFCSDGNLFPFFFRTFIVNIFQWTAFMESKAIDTFNIFFDYNALQRSASQKCLCVYFRNAIADHNALYLAAILKSAVIITAIHWTCMRNRHRRHAVRNDKFFDGASIKYAKVN